MAMDVSDKVATAIASALSYLENSIDALNKKDYDVFAKKVWHVVAELEYALFLFSIIIQDDLASKLKADPDPKKVELNQILIDATHFLKSAETLVKAGNFSDAYGNVRNARNYVLKVQEELLKKSREESKKQ
ncbi:MAG: hypothetical protein QXJ11_06115 [Candidatus Bathyarchaeia archaeon]